ncbi:glycosyltransferase family 4 protein [Micrococcus sp.]|uniref:glycosyltransferase family 4 protein n=1 Tax=Micrococcus sp. TaxID=1271 RepID=UPI002A90B160|nr:glycosyltransferase family 4 protein [Micrococcus sp.]MDY6056155.1 glycosyltransferase family 4 protein [Micrococcus sp.]
MTAPPKILFIDHSGQPGGGQLGLERAWEQKLSAHSHVAFLTGGAVSERMADRHPESVHIRRADPDFAPRRDLTLSLPWILRLIRRVRPGIIVVNSAAAAKAVAPLIPLFSVPVVYYARTDLSKNSLKRWKRWLLTAATFRHFDAFIANSEWTRDTLPDVLRRRPVEIAYPVSGIQETAEDRTAHVPSDGETFLVVSLSRLEPWKGQEHLIRAVAQADAELRRQGKTISLELYGGTVLADQQYIHHLESLAEELTAPVHFMGHVSDVSSVLDRAHALVLSSIQPEPFGQVVIQAMGHGVLTIVPDAGGPREIITHEEDGLQYPPGDAESLASILVGMANDPERHHQVASRGMQRATAFADSSTTPGLEESIRRLWTRLTPPSSEGTRESA